MFSGNDSEPPAPAPPPDENLMVVEDGLAQFIRVPAAQTPHYVEGEVHRVTGWDDQRRPVDKELYLRYYMKWDGCCHVWFGERVAPAGAQDGYLHLCGEDSWKHHTQLMTELFAWAKKTIPIRA